MHLKNSNTFKILCYNSKCVDLILFKKTVEINSLKVLSTSIAGRYAIALFREAKKSNCLDEITENFKKLDTFFKNNASIKKILTTKCINNKDLDEGWIAVGAHLSFCPMFTSFLRQVAKNKRFDILNTIKYIYKVAIAKYKNKRRVLVISAVELLPEQKERIEQVISKLFTEKTIISYKIKPKIIGGIKISSEEKVYDASLYAKIKQMVAFLKNAKV